MKHPEFIVPPLDPGANYQLTPAAHDTGDGWYTHWVAMDRTTGEIVQADEAFPHLTDTDCEIRVWPFTHGCAMADDFRRIGWAVL